MAVTAAESDTGDIRTAIGHCDLRQIFLWLLLSTGGELGYGATWSGFGHLTAGVGIDFGVQHQDVHFSAGRDYVVKSAKANVISPTVTSDHPNAFLDQRIGHQNEIQGKLRTLLLISGTRRGVVGKVLQR